MDWLDCPSIERSPGNVLGVPLIKRSRVRPEGLVANKSEGVAWLADAYDLPEATAREVLAFTSKKSESRPSFRPASPWQRCSSKRSPPMTNDQC